MGLFLLATTGTCRLLVAPAELTGRFELSVKIGLHRGLGRMLFVTAVLMLIAGHPGIAQGASEPVLDHGGNVASTSPDNLDALAGKDIDRPLPHIARQHERDAHLGQGCGNVRLAATSRWRSNDFLGLNLLVVDGEDGEGLTVPKVTIHLILTGR